MALPYQIIKSLTTGSRPSIISSAEITEKQFQPASLDCTLGNRAYRISSSFLPRENETIAELLATRTLYDFSLEDSAILETNTSYIIPLRESLNLPPNILGMASPKSSIGRVDVFVRVLADKVSQYDTIPAGYAGPLYLEVIPLTFALRITPGLALTQMRFRDISESFPTEDEILTVHEQNGIVFDAEGRKLLPEELRLNNNVISFTVDLTSRDIVGYKARSFVNSLLDLTSVGTHSETEFWEPIYRQPDGELILQPNSFYIIAAKERVAIPANYAAEIAPYDPATGELRSHYAGFFDPGFGTDADNSQGGNIIVLEVRAHSTPFRLTDGQTICKMIFEKLVDTPEKIYGKASGSNYTDAQIRISKYFKK